LTIVVSLKVPIHAPSFEPGTAVLGRKIMHVVRSLNAGKNHLKTLKIRYISCYEGGIEKVRP